MEAATRPRSRRPRLRYLQFGAERPAYGGAARFRARVFRRFRLSLRIPDNVKVVDWLQEHVTLPTDSTQKTGKFKAFPYQVDPLNDMGDPSVREIVMMKSIRVGWTQMMGLGMVYCNVHLASPSVLITINGDIAKDFVKTFWEPLFRWKRNPNKALKAIRRRFVKGDKQDQWNFWSFLNGGAARIMPAGSPDAFRFYPARKAFFDEPDAENASGQTAEGGRIELLRGRTVQYDDSCVVLGCSPTNTLTSQVWKYFQNTDMRRRFVPCPHCSGVYDLPMAERNAPRKLWGLQYLKFGDATTPFGIKFDVENHVVVKAVYRCDHCGQDIEEVTRDGWSWKKWMDRNGRWIPTNGSWECTDEAANAWVAITPSSWAERRHEFVAAWEENEKGIGRTNGVFTVDDETGERVPVYTTARKGKRGYQISSLYSQLPGITWMLLATEWLTKLADGRSGIQEFVNQHLGEPWEPGGLFSLPNEAELSSITVPYDAEIPPDVVGLTLGADIQEGKRDGSEKPRVEVSIYGWGRRATAYLIGHWVIDAPFPSQAAEMALDTLITRKFKRADGRELGILASCVDSGWATQQVYDYCSARSKWMVFAVKGAKEENGLKKDYGLVGREASTNKETGHSWYMVSGLTGKEELAYKLDAGQALGGIFFPHSATRAGGGRFFSGLVAERAVTIGRGGVKWVRKGALTGEPLDCFVYAAAARELARRRYSTFRDLDAAANHLKLPEEPSLVTVDRTQQDKSAQAALISGLLEPPPPEQRVALPGRKRKRRPMDFTVSKKSPRARTGWRRV